MKRCVFTVLVLMLAMPAWAGLFGGNEAPRRIPVPARDFSAVVLDEAGVRTELDRVTLDGEVFLFGAHGKAQVAVPFEDIVSVRFEDIDEDHTAATITVKQGEPVTLELDADRPIFGKARFGNYRIEVQDMETLELK